MISHEKDVIEIRRFEVGAIINDNRFTIKTTNDIEEATKYYKRAVSAYNPDTNHIIIFLFDYDKNTNINYYDSEVD